MKYYFLHPKTLKICDIHNGRSLWEDHASKAEWIVVKEVGPAMKHWKEAMDSSVIQDQTRLIDDIKTDLDARGYDGDLVDEIIKKIKS